MHPAQRLDQRSALSTLATFAAGLVLVAAWVGTVALVTVVFLTI